MQIDEIFERCKTHAEFDLEICRREAVGFRMNAQSLEKLSYYIDNKICGSENKTNSWILYWCGVTTKRPIEKDSTLFHHQSFRVTIPDCDLDFPDNRRKEIIDYISAKYGENRVAQVVTFGKMKARMSVRDVARALGYSQEYGDKLAKSIKNTPGKPINITNSLDDKSEYYSADFKQYYDTEPKAREVINYALSLEDKARQTGVHAAAVLITPTDLTDYIPLMRGGKTAYTKHIAQWEYVLCESIGLLKVDCLGLGTLSIIELACELINQRHGTSWDYHNIPYNEPSAYQLLCDTNLIGIFQVENQGLRKAIGQLQPSKFSQVADIISLYRPGPIQYIPQYVEQTHNPKIVDYKHPMLEPILAGTAGVCIYQEQVIRIFVELAHYSEVEADGLRKAISKKDVDKITKGRKRFVEGCQQNSISPKIAAEIYDDIEKFALYGFNRCVSHDTKMLRLSKSSFAPTVEEMYRIANDLEYAQKTGHVNLHYRYRYNGYGYSYSLDGDKKLRKNKIKDIRYSGLRPVYKVTTNSGKNIECTLNHKFPTSNGIKYLQDIVIGDELYVDDGYNTHTRKYLKGDGVSNLPLRGQQGFQRKENSGYIYFENKKKELQINKIGCELCEQFNHNELHHKDLDTTNNTDDNLQWLCNSCHKLVHYQLGRTKHGAKGRLTRLERITSIEYIGEKRTYDVEMNAPNHTFVTDTGIVTCNSHACAYARLTLITAWLKANYQIEYLTACLMVEGVDEKKRVKYINDAKRNGIAILPPKIGLSKAVFHIDGGAIRFGWQNIKEVGDKVSKRLAKINDINELAKLNLDKGVMEALTSAGVFDEYGIAPKGLLLSNLDGFMTYLKVVKRTDAGQYAFTYPDLQITNKVAAKLSTYERKYLGVWLRHHPLSDNARYKKALRQTTTPLTGSLDLAQVDDGENINFVAVVQGIEEITTKRGDKMAFVTFSDDDGLFECVVFPKIYNGLAMAENQIYYVKGRVQYGEEQITIIVNEMKHLSQWE